MSEYELPSLKKDKKSVNVYFKEFGITVKMTPRDAKRIRQKRKDKQQRTLEVEEKAI